MEKIQKETNLKDKKEQSLLIMLQEAQNNFGFIPEECMSEAAQSFNISKSTVFGVASFYSFLSTKPLGKNVIRICKNLPCNLKNSRMVIEHVADKLGIKPGETTPDGKFSLELTNCIGACDKAPAMLINNDVHVNLTPEKITQILNNYN